MAVNVPGLIVVIILYILIVIVGILAAKYVKPSGDTTQTEMNMVAGRNLGLVVGIFTMTATSVGGGYLSGTTEGIATTGLLWTVYPFTIVIAFTIGSCVFAKPMRERRYLTLLDPLQERFGDFMTGLLLLGALFAELVWGASILIALGTSLSIIIDMGVNYSIVISAAVALLYTCFGAAVSVAYTDVVQLLLVVFGMVLCVPFAMTNPNVGDFGATKATWLGTITKQNAATWVDYVVAQIFGGIPWNTYFMRILAAKSVRQAQVVSIAGGLFGWAMAVPPALLGIVGVSADWNSTTLGVSPIVSNNSASLMPLVIEHFTPKAVSIIALAAIVAAVMSSMDSIILSSSSMFTHNIYRLSFRKQAGDRELRIVQLVAMFVVTSICTIIAVLSTTVYGIFILTADIVYVILFPQFVCSVFLRFTNAYGSFFGFVVGIILRFGGGEPSLSIKPFIKYPFYDEAAGQLFPFKTFAMLCTFVTILIISVIARELFIRNYIPVQYDITGKVVPAYEVSTSNVEPGAPELSKKNTEEMDMKYLKTVEYSQSNEAYVAYSSSDIAHATKI